MTAESDKLKVIHAGYLANVSAETGQWLRAAQFYVEAARAAFLLHGPHRDETRSIFKGTRKCSDTENCMMCEGCPTASPVGIEEQAENVIDHTLNLFGAGIPTCARTSCSNPLMYSARAKGRDLCGPCHRRAYGKETPFDLARAAEDNLHVQCPGCGGLTMSAGSPRSCANCGRRCTCSACNPDAAKPPVGLYDTDGSPELTAAKTKALGHTLAPAPCSNCGVKEVTGGSPNACLGCGKRCPCPVCSMGSFSDEPAIALVSHAPEMCKDEKCLRCGREAEFHVVGPTDEHGVMFEEFWCKACYPGPGGD